MEGRISKPVKTIGCILTPEFSPEPDQHPNALKFPALSEKSLAGYTKPIFWIFVSIAISIGLGQLN